jgi:acyl-CoA synthetase (AMP-forming)/AMP-acid ligase II
MTPQTIGALLRQQAALGDKTFLVVDEARLSYGDAELRSRRIASALLAAGAGRGSRVAFLFGNGPDFAVAWFAATRIGATAMPLSTMSTAFELRYLLLNSDAEYLIAAETYRGRDLRGVLAEAIGAEPVGQLALPRLPVLRQVWFEVGALETMGVADDPLVSAAESQVSKADPMVVVHTSGSTSAPKGVVHTHGQVIRNMERQNAARHYTAADGLFSNSPFFWVGGLAYSFLATFIAGAKLICSSADPRGMLDLLEKERPTMCNGVASTVLALANDPTFASRDLSFLRRGNLYPIMPADARPPDPELRYNLLGMTEAGSVCLFGRHEQDLPEAKRGSFGIPVEGIEARVVDPESGEDASRGELWLRGPNVMQGYLARERHECFDKDGWYHSGDMMSLDADGDFFFKGRTGDIIRTAGAQVSPREVEGAISDLLDGRMSIVVGLPDPERGQIIVAVIVGDEPFDVEALRTGLRGRLSPYKVPRRFVAFGEKDLPTLSSGKVDFRKLVEIVGVR